MKTICYILFLITLTTVICVDPNVWTFHSSDVSCLSIRDDKLWAISSSNSGKKLVSWDKSGKKWTVFNNGADLISVGTNYIYGIDGSRKLGKHAFTNSAARLLFDASWTDTLKTAADVKVGTNNDIYYIDSTSYGIYKYDESGSSATRVGTTETAMKVAATPDGKAWAVDTSNNIIQWTGTAWQTVTGAPKARDIIIGSDGIPYIVTTTSRPGGFEIKKLDATSKVWVLVPGIGGLSLALDANNSPYVVTGDNKVYYKKCNTDGTFFLKGTCQPCSKNCATCNDWRTCQSCKTSFFMSKNRCFASCPTGTFLSEGVCKACLDGCTQCADAATCQSCKPGYGLSNNVCKAPCPEGTYLSSGVCQACPNGCKSCTDSKTCKSCQDTYFMSNNLCVLSCPDGAYKGVGVCKGCPSTCATCDATTCLTCEPTFGLLGTACVASCPVGKYLSAGACQDCSTGCARCTDANTCQACKPTFGLSGKKCESTCPDGTFMSEGACQGCPSTCATCSNPNTCTKCPGVKVLSNGQCLTSCPTGTIAVNGVCSQAVVVIRPILEHVV